MNLADWQITKLVESHGMIEPFEPSALNAYGYDVALFGEILELKKSWTKPINALKPPPIEAWKRHRLNAGDEFVVEFGGWYLGRSVEGFKIPDYVTMQMHNRSKYCRAGLTPNAGLAPAEAGWEADCFVFEFSCHHSRGGIYTMGKRIAQAMFTTGLPCAQPYDDSHVYQGQDGVWGPMG